MAGGLVSIYTASCANAGTRVTGAILGLAHTWQPATGWSTI